VRVLITGMSGTGKSTLVAELRRRGALAYDVDDDGLSEPRAGGRWGWRRDLVARLLDEHRDGDLFLAGCSEEQAEFGFDLKVLLTADAELITARLASRTGNSWGRDPAELAMVLDDLRTVEPLLRRSCDAVIATTVPVTEVADRVLALTEEHRAAGRR
jgi:uridine kinase